MTAPSNVVESNRGGSLLSKRVGMSLMLLSLALLPLCASAQTSGDERLIATLEDGSLKATLHGDVSFLETFLAADYRQIGAGGELTNKDYQIRLRRDRKIVYEALDLKDRNIHIYGDVAVVVMHSFAKYTINGRSIEGDFRATRVWYRQNGQWKIVNFQTNKVTSPQPGRLP